MKHMNRHWFVKDESHERPGFCCLAIRETESERLVADLADVPDEVPDFIERAWNEARLLAASQQLFEACKAMIAWHEKHEPAGAIAFGKIIATIEITIRIPCPVMCRTV